MPLAPVMRRTLDLRDGKAPWTAKVAACAILVLFVVLVARIIAARRRAMQSTQFAARAAAEASAQETLVAHEGLPATADPVPEPTSPSTSRPRAISLPSSTTSVSSMSSSSNTTLRSISRASSATPTRRRSASPPPPARTHVLVDGRPTHRLVAAKCDSGFDDNAEPSNPPATCDWVPVEDRMHASMHSDAASTSSLNGSWALCRSLGDVTLAPTVPAECTADLPTASFVAQEMDDGVEMGALAAAALVEAAASVCEPDPAVSDSDEEHGGARSEDEDDGSRWAGQQRSMATRWEAFYRGEMEIWQVLYEPVQDAAGDAQVWDGPGYSVVRVKDVEGKTYFVHLYPPPLADAARHWCDFVDHVLTAAQTKGSDSVCTTTASVGDAGRSSDLLPPVHGHGELLPDMPPGRHDRTPSASTTASLPSSIASSSRSGSSSKPLRLVPTDKFFPLRNGAFARITPVYAQSPAMMRDLTRRPTCGAMPAPAFRGWDAAVMLNLLRDVVPVLAQVLAYVLDRITSATGSAGNTGGTARRAILRAWVADADVAIVGGVGDALNGKFAVLSVLPRAPGGPPLPLGHAVAQFVLDLVAPPLAVPLPPATNPRALAAAIRDVCGHATLARAVADTATAWTPLHSSSVAVAGGEDGGDEIAALHRAVKALRHVRARIKREMATSAVVAPEGGVRMRRARRESVATSVASISEVDGERDEAVGSEACLKRKEVAFAPTPEPARDHGTASPLVPPFASAAASWTSSTDGGVPPEVVAMEAAVATGMSDRDVVARKPVPV
ncbi:hypothetical protein GGF32_002329 [Allomyces javanicus]|nr:hypothetical protein GGF32_002329 [Allomyces javanicus]